MKSSYLETFKSSPGMVNVIDYIISQVDNSPTTDDPQSLEFSVNSLIHAIVTKDGNLFSQVEHSYIRKTPETNSPWINNNYLIFLLLIGQKVFNKDSAWLKSAIEVRKRNDIESGIVFDFFNSVLTGSNMQHGPQAPLQLIYAHLANPSSISTLMINASLIEFNRIKTFPCFQNEFLNILYLGAFDSCLFLKDMADLNLHKRIQKFNINAKRKISALSNIILYLFFALFLFGIFLFIKYVFLELSEIIKNTIITAFGLAGLTFLEIFTGRKKIKKWIEKRIRRFWGFELLEDGQ